MVTRRSIPGSVLYVALAIVLLLGSQPAAAQSKAGYPRVMQGPMLGPVTSTSATIWIRGSGDFEYEIEYSLSPRFETSQLTKPQRATKADDYTMTFLVDGLRPETTYHYRVRVEGEVSKYLRARVPGTFDTYPDRPAPFRVAFGSCARVQASLDQPIWSTVQTLDPDMFFWLGDNIYGDALDPDILAEEYRRQRDLRFFRPVMMSTTHLATWDDHDFGLNNHDRTNPIKDKALRVFKQYWANPSHGTPETPGVFFKHSHSGVDFFFLDVRYHRDPNNDPVGPDKTMLGEAQYEWLIEGLSESTATFKVLVSGSGFTLAKGDTGDAWSAYRHERDRLFNEIVERGIEGVVLMSGDTHAAELNAIESPHPRGYTLYEFVSSPLAQAPTRSRQPISGDERRVRPYYNMAANVGILDIDTTAPDPIIRADVVNMFGIAVWPTFELRASELVIKDAP